ncbi:MAG: diaminopimelate epimerase [Flavobacteriales bacterium]|nr:diaminopimelate epimerase [Flavobacteriales bacterium]
MNISFEKYQGTGNDFVMIDNREALFDVSTLPIAQICNRRFGIGADGLIVIELLENLDFNMIYFNSDGSQSFCGNGSRCAVMFAKSLGIIGHTTHFLSTDGTHFAEIEGDLVKLKMHDVLEAEYLGEDIVLNTGSPHFVRFCPSVSDIKIIEEAHIIRYNNRFSEKGINVNFVGQNQNGISIRTYERGVEDETLSCGTGVTAAAIANSLKLNLNDGFHRIPVISQGGNLTVEFTKSGNHFTEIYLIGPAKKTFSGLIEI